MAKVKVIVDGIEYEVDVEELPGGKFRVSFENKEYTVEAKGLGIDFSTLSAPPKVSVPTSTPAPSPPVSLPATPTPAPAGEGVVTAPMPGKVLRVLVGEGERVKTGQGLLVLEAMKMENEIPSPRDGIVKKIFVKKGDTVNTGDPLIEIG